MTALDLGPMAANGGTVLPPDLLDLAGDDASGGVLGVDIGSSGGLALVTCAGVLIDVAPMPVLQDGSRSHSTVNGPLLAALVRHWSPVAIFIELVGPLPGEAAGGAFSFGRAQGLIEGVLAEYRAQARP